MKAFLSHQTTAASQHTIIQPKLMVNAPNDVYEQEADAVADRVMRMPLVSSKSIGTQGMLASSVQRKCAHWEEEKKKPIMRKAESGGGFETSPAFASQLSNTRGGGQAMPRETKSFMESRFGQDFSHVRLHTGGIAADMSADIQAKAFTHGSDIYFNQGEFAPNTEGGQKLLAHELTHVIQQGSFKNIIGEKSIFPLMKQYSQVPNIQMASFRDHRIPLKCSNYTWSNLSKFGKYTQISKEIDKNTFIIGRENPQYGLHTSITHKTGNLYNVEYKMKRQTSSPVPSYQPYVKTPNGTNIYHLNSTPNGISFEIDLLPKDLDKILWYIYILIDQHPLCLAQVIGHGYVTIVKQQHDEG
jgi:Domain of unknown function (DUF4157)